MEYLTAEIRNLAGNAACDQRKFRIFPMHGNFAFKSDKELNKILSDAIIASGGVLPNIKALLPKKKGANKGGEKATVVHSISLYSQQEVIYTYTSLLNL